MVNSHDRFFAMSTDLLCIMGFDGFFKDVNPAWTTVLGWPADALLGIHANDFVYEDDRAQTRDVYRAMIDGTPLVRFRNRFRHADGSIRWLSWMAMPSADEGVIYGVARDVTQLKDQEDQVREAMEAAQAAEAKLAAANEELESFAYSVSHDLRAPLRGISGFTEQLLAEYHDQFDDRGRDRLNRVHAGAQRMSALIDDLLLLSRASRATVHLESVDLSEIARSVVEEIRVGDATRSVETVIHPNLMAEADPGLLRLVLQNLLGNAWKFTGRSELPRIEFGVTHRDGERVYFVRDNGAGFDPEYASKLFAPFQRLHAAADFPGTGIGLATVQRIIRRHYGQIWGEGIVGSGATFYFTLNAKPSSQTGASLEAA